MSKQAELKQGGTEVGGLLNEQPKNSGGQLNTSPTPYTMKGLEHPLLPTKISPKFIRIGGRQGRVWRSFSTFVLLIIILSMCGRYTQTKNFSQLIRKLSLLKDIDPEESRLATPRYNIAPSQQIACIRYNECVEPLDEERQRHLVLKQWGFLPSWAKDTTKVKPQINARGETVTNLPTFRSSYHKRRCIVLADGFYEWRKEGMAKQPYYFFLQDRRPFGFAGNWPRCQLPDKDSVETVALITTEANPFMKYDHHRIPVILDPMEWWLRHDQHYNTQVSPRSLLKPYSGNDLIAVPVSRAINNPRNDDRSLIEAER